jgi:hypothetical protein
VVHPTKVCDGVSNPAQSIDFCGAQPPSYINRKLGVRARAEGCITFRAL